MTGRFQFLPCFALAIAVSWLVVVVWPHLQLGGLEPVAIEETGVTYPPIRSGEALVGAEMYRSLGCQYCHTRQVRSGTMGADIARGWGKRRTVARDYIRDRPVMLGSIRFGPDLANLGCRETNATVLLLRLYKPSAMAPLSPMPSYRHLFDVRPVPAGGSESRNLVVLRTDSSLDPGFEVIPSAEARALVAYLLSLKADELFFEVYPRENLQTTNFLSAAQPQPNDLGEVKAFVPSWALCRAALKGATSSPNGEMRAGSVAEKFEGKSLEARADLQFRRRLSNIILGSKGRTLVTN